jgi:hypothetical protein
MGGFFKGTITPNLDILIASKCLTIHRWTHPHLSVYNLIPSPRGERVHLAGTWDQWPMGPLRRHYCIKPSQDPMSHKSHWSQIHWQ